MTKKELKDEHERKLHLAVGSFVVNFEYLALKLRLYLLGMFPDREKHGYLGRMFVQDLSFDQMVQKIRQISGYHLADKTDYKDLLDVDLLILDACSAINTKRNHIVHGAWMVNYRTLFGEPEPETPQTAVMRKSNDLRGDFSFWVYSIDDINKLTDLSKRLAKHFDHVFLPDQPRKQFYVDDDDLKAIKADILLINGKPQTP